MSLPYRPMPGTIPERVAAFIAEAGPQTTAELAEFLGQRIESVVSSLRHARAGGYLVAERVLALDGAPLRWSLPAKKDEPVDGMRIERVDGTLVLHAEGERIELTPARRERLLELLTEGSDA